MNDFPNNNTTSDLPQSASMNSRTVGRISSINFRLIAWSCLVVLEVYYLVAVFLPFFALGVYKMSRRDMFNDPNLTFPDPALLWPCLLFQCGVIPLLIFA